MPPPGANQFYAYTASMAAVLAWSEYWWHSIRGFLSMLRKVYPVARLDNFVGMY